MSKQQKQQPHGEMFDLHTLQNDAMSRIISKAAEDMAGAADLVDAFTDGYKIKWQDIAPVSRQIALTGQVTMLNHSVLLLVHNGYSAIGRVIEQRHPGVRDYVLQTIRYWNEQMSGDEELLNLSDAVEAKRNPPPKTLPDLILPQKSKLVGLGD